MIGGEGIIRIRSGLLSIACVLLLLTISVPARADIDANYLGSAPGRYNSIEVMDIDEDDNFEIVVGNYEGYLNIIELRGSDYFEEWRSESLGTRLWGVKVADLDSDDTNEIIVGTGEGNLFVFDAKTRELEWEVSDLVRDVHGLEVGDVDADGHLELVVGTGYKTDEPWGTLYIFDGRNHSLEAKLEKLGSRVRGIAIHDIDKDGRTEIIFGTGHSLGELPGEGYLHVYEYDGSTYKEEWISPDLNGCPQGVLVEDVDGDGNYEIVIGNGYRYNEGYLIIYRFVGGGGVGFPETYQEVLWSGNIGPKAYGLDAGDIDGDGIIEIVIGNQPGNIWIFDGSTHEVEWKSDIIGTDIFGINLIDIDRDGQVEIIAAQGGYQGKGDFTSAYSTPHIYIIDGSTYNIEVALGEPDYLAWGLQIVIIVQLIILLVLLNIYVRRRRAKETVEQEQEEVSA